MDAVVLPLRPLVLVKVDSKHLKWYIPRRELAGGQRGGAMRQRTNMSLVLLAIVIPVSTVGMLWFSITVVYQAVAVPTLARLDAIILAVVPIVPSKKNLSLTSQRGIRLHPALHPGLLAIATEVQGGI